MRASDFINESEVVQEIERLSPGDYEGGKESLYDKQYGKQVKRLPGGSGLLYSTSQGRWGGIDIKLWDPNGKDFIAQKANYSVAKPVREPRESVRDYEWRLGTWEKKQRELKAPGQLIGRLSVSDAKFFPLKGAMQVDTITVDEDYRGVGLAKALYGIVLTIMKRPLLAGSSQTPGGRRNWLSLSQIPGVEMKGYISFEDDQLDPALAKRGYTTATPAQANKNIETIMGKLGGQYIGRARHGEEYFAFDVQPDTTKQELKAYVDTTLSKVYGGYNSNTGLYAVWHG